MRTLALVALALTLAPAAAAGTVRISPPVVQAGEAQLFTLVVEPEQEGVVLRTVELYPPPDFTIESFPETEGWHRDWTIQSQATVVQKAIWTREGTPTGDEEIEDATEQAATFQFVATPKAARAYRLEVRQSYDDGSVVHWRGAASRAFPSSPATADVRPAPTVEAAALAATPPSEGTSTIAIVALVAALAALAVAIVAVVLARR